MIYSIIFENRIKNDKKNKSAGRELRYFLLVGWLVLIMRLLHRPDKGLEGDGFGQEHVKTTLFASLNVLGQAVVGQRQNATADCMGSARDLYRGPCAACVFSLKVL
jgi:hypothetical protein